MSKLLSPKISIITPSYNQGHFIEQTICSVLDQGYPNLEFIIIDGGSTDNTVNIIKKYEKHVTYWVSEKDKGQSDAINKGILRSTGEIFNWLNSDDYYEPGTLMHVAEQFADKSITAYCGISRIFSETTEKQSQGTDIYPDNLAKTIGWARIDQPETFLRKSVFDSIGPINESLHYIMDRDLWIRYLAEYGLNSIKKDEQLLVHFRLHGNSKTVSLQENFLKEHHSLYYTYALQLGYDKYAQIIRQLFGAREIKLEYRIKKEAIKEDWEKILNYFLLYQGMEYYAKNDYKQAFKIITEINREILLPVELAELKKISFRINYLPVSLKKFVNKIRK